MPETGEVIHTCERGRSYSSNGVATRLNRADRLPKCRFGPGCLVELIVALVAYRVSCLPRAHGPLGPGVGLVPANKA
jgi:hypothetical protein